MEKYLSVIAASPLFAGVPEEDVRSALSCLSPTVREYPRGAFILRAGERTEAAGMLLSGAALVIREDFWGGRHILSHLSPGDLFAESYACAGAPAGVSVRAESAAEALLLDVGRVLNPCSRQCGFHSRLIQNLLAVMAEKNLALNEKLSHVTARTTREKLLSYLSAEASRQGGAELTIPFDRQGLADYLSVDRSALSRELGRMRGEGLVDFRKNRFRLKPAGERR